MADFKPTAHEVYSMRERTGAGLVECKKQLQLQNMYKALCSIDERALTNDMRTMLDVLKTLVNMEISN